MAETLLNYNPVERRGKGGKERNSKGSQKNSKSLQTNNVGSADAAGLRNSGQLPTDAAPEAQTAGHDAALALPPPGCLSCSSENDEERVFFFWLVSMKSGLLGPLPILASGRVGGTKIAGFSCPLLMLFDRRTPLLRVDEEGINELRKRTRFAAIVVDDV
ncbi:hypothetical protein TIFTF001_042643 [Ficus carica]|uniref:Uncharacterized protein n=1 Tax=Ficus carica TaxID=3494 RepID=A0AA87ZQ74_FICCA|nr:hypothetical protein TIFTF001_042643 [Ficus carica]